MREESFAHLRDSVIDRIHTALRVPPQAVTFELHRRPGDEVAAVALTLDRDRIPDPHEYAQLVADARQIVQDEIDRHGYPVLLAPPSATAT